MVTQRWLTAPAAALLLAGCAGNGGDWPSLAARPGEAKPLVPRAALACPTCGPEPATPAAPVALAPTPADAEPRYQAISATIDAVETALPALRRTLDMAVRATAGGSAGSAASGSASSDAAAAADIAGSRWVQAFVPLTGARRQLDQLGDDIAGTSASPDWTGRLAALEARLTALEAARDAAP